VEAPRDFETETQLFANPLILKAVSLNLLKMLGKNLSGPFHSTLSIPIYSDLFYHNFITVAIHNFGPLKDQKILLLEQRINIELGEGERSSEAAKHHPGGIDGVGQERGRCLPDRL